MPTDSGFTVLSEPQETNNGASAKKMNRLLAPMIFFIGIPGF
jgi:hypothetical protein